MYVIVKCSKLPSNPAQACVCTDIYQDQLFSLLEAYDAKRVFEGEAGLASKYTIYKLVEVE